MEKGIATGMNRVIKIVLTGPECTGKSTLAMQLAKQYHTISIPEYARDYIENLGRPYDYNDVEHIAKTQVSQLIEQDNSTNRIVFFDTYLIITKIWFDWVYKKRPGWFDNELSKDRIHLYLLCNTDIPWVADPVRENGGEMREKLFNVYRDELEKNNFRYKIISGTGDKRLRNAVSEVDNLMNELIIANTGNDE